MFMSLIDPAEITQTEIQIYLKIKICVFLCEKLSWILLRSKHVRLSAQLIVTYFRWRA